MKPLLTHDQDTYLRSIARGKSVQQCVDAINARYGTAFTHKQIKNYKSKNKILSGCKPCEFIDHKLSRILTGDQHQWIVDHVKGISTEELTRRLNETFDTSFTVQQIKSYKHNHKLSSGLTGHFEKGHAPANKGKKMSAEQYSIAQRTMFKPGVRPVTTDPIGTEKVLADGYTYVKVDDQLKAPKKVNWKQKHLLLWEQHNGPVPEGHVLLFLDGDRQHIGLDNLAVVSRGQLAILNRQGLLKKDADLNRSSIEVAKLIRAINKFKQKSRGKNNDK